METVVEDALVESDDVEYVELCGLLERIINKIINLLRLFRR